MSKMLVKLILIRFFENLIADPLIWVAGSLCGAKLSPHAKNQHSRSKKWWFWNFGPIWGDFTPLCPLFRGKMEKPSGWFFLLCKNIPARKKSALSGENWRFWYLGPIWGDFTPLCPLLGGNSKNWMDGSSWLATRIVWCEFRNNRSKIAKTPPKSVLGFWNWGPLFAFPECLLTLFHMGFLTYVVTWGGGSKSTAPLLSLISWPNRLLSAKNLFSDEYFDL